jgi:hypothetical protein
VSAAELERWLQTHGTLFAARADGWPAGEGDAEPSRSPTEQMLRRVLARWDLRDPDGWRRLLPPSPRTAESALARFAESDLRRQLAGARAWRREVEYLLDLGSPGEPLPAVFGEVDCLWQDADGQWHLLFYLTEAGPAGGREAAWKERQVGLALAACAVRDQVGTWPRSVALAFLHDGTALARPAARLPHRPLLAEAVTGLRQLARRAV